MSGQSCCRTMKKKKQSLFVLLSVLLLFLSTCCLSARAIPLLGNRRQRRAAAKKIEREMTPEELEEKAAADAKREFVVDTTSDTLKALYGCVLIVYGRYMPLQLLIFTVMRASGYAAVERAMVELRKNIRQAVLSAIYHSPSLLMARRAIKDLDDRREAARNIARETEKAKADGVVTLREYRRIRKLQRKQVQSLNRDIRRIQRGSSAIARIYKTLDLEEVGEVLRRLFFIVTTVLAAAGGENSSGSIIGTIVSKYCRFWCLGGLFMETNLKLGLPISRLIVGRIMEPLDDDDIAQIVENKPRQESVNKLGPLQKILGTILMYLLSAIMVLWWRSDVGIHLNRAFLAASLVVRSLSAANSRIEAYNAKEDDEDTDKKKDAKESDEQQQVAFLEGFWGGIWTVVLAIAALYCGQLVDKGVLVAPDWFNLVFLKLEHFIEGVVVLADKI